MCIQEASLPQNYLFHPKINDFDLFNHSRQIKRGDRLAVFLHKFLQMNNVTWHIMNHLKAVSAEVYFIELFKVTIVNIYIPGQGVTLKELKTISLKVRNYLIVGDFNAKYYSWNDGPSNQNTINQ